MKSNSGIKLVLEAVVWSITAIMRALLVWFFWNVTIPHVIPNGPEVDFMGALGLVIVASILTNSMKVDLDK